MLKKIIILTCFIGLVQAFDESLGYAGKKINGKFFDKLKDEELKKLQPKTPEIIKYDKENPNSKDVLYNNRKNSIEASLRVIHADEFKKRSLSEYYVSLWESYLTKEMLYYTITGNDYETSEFNKKRSEDDEYDESYYKDLFFCFAMTELTKILLLQKKSFSCICCKVKPCCEKTYLEADDYPTEAVPHCRDAEVLEESAREIINAALAN